MSHVLMARAKMLCQIRQFMHERGVLEVETPQLSQAGNTDPHIDSMVVSAPDQRYLHTSPEYPMKRLLAKGSGDIYQVCKVFRQGEAGKHHNPEFTMLEYYRIGFHWQQLVDEVYQLLGLLLDRPAIPVNSMTYREVFLRRLGFDPETTNIGNVEKIARSHGLSIEDEFNLAMGLDFLFSTQIQPNFDSNCFTVVHDFPAKQAALAAIETQGSREVALRFEGFLGGLEICNGYQEATALAQIRHRLLHDAQARQQAGKQSPPIDDAFLQDLNKGLPQCAGVAIGLDRVLMQHLGRTEMKQVMHFPWELA